MFRRVLIANRGEIAARIQRTCHRLGIETVAVFSDADANAPHVRAATKSVRLGPPPVKESYLNVAAILAAAKETGAEAVHPGYGLLSEKQEFAKAIRDAGLVFIGPPDACLDAFGDKIKARDVARRVGAEPPPGTNGPIAVDDEAAIVAEAERIGYPLLVKAAGGGGGIGMQVVDDPSKLMRAARTCSDRGASAFNDARVYMERYISSPKHIEVQVLCDKHGQAVALGERECSLQRRHQKIVEESPSPAPFFRGEEGEKKRAWLLETALKVVTSVGYEGAGTVEFVASQTGEIYFLEVNARLQVEHCVTEMVTGIDLVEQQLRVAAGEKLAPEVLSPKRRGHSVEARVYAENPLKMFAPQPGKIQKLRWPDHAEDLRIETGVEEGGDVTPFYDPMIAKVVAWAETREAAIARLNAALAATQLELVGPAGPAATNIDFLQKLLASEEVAGGAFDTAYAEKLAKSLK
ncbi:MAG: ATP-grasp domain-containing protein [Polyangiaceae bacterium]|nr:ATP-grasp domain-containing protein [Polyangiaceae bacterium]